MNFYSTVRLLHIAGALMFFAAIGVDLAGVVALGRARSTEQVRRALEGYRVNGILGPLSLLLVLLPGMYMATTAWAWQPWLRVSFGGLLLIAILNSAISRRRLSALASALPSDEQRLSPSVERQARDPLLRGAFVVRALLASGIVVLMSTKPPLDGAILVLAAALVVAALLSAPLWMRPRSVERRA